MNVPKIRFNDFDDNIIKISIKELGNVITGTTPSTTDRSNYGDEYLWASPVDMGDFKYINNTKTKLSEKGFNKTRCVPKDSILITCIGSTIGKTGMASKEMSTNQQINTLIPNKIYNSDYLYYCINFNFPRFLNKISFQAVPIISKSEFEKLEVSITKNIYEQEKIGKLLSLLDKKIELQSKKIEDLKLFTKNTISNELNNLQNYNIFKFKDICNIQTGKSNTQDKCDDGIYPFYIRSENIERSNNYIFDCEAVLTIGDGNIGKVFFYENGKFDCHQRVYVLNNFKNVLGKYVYYYFSAFFYKRAMSMSAKNTVDSVRMEMISDMIIKVPQEKEQIKMINLFSSLDKKLGLEQNKLDKLQELKKGLMQNMFV